MHGALIRADHHQMLLIDLQVRCGLQERFDELIGGHDIFEAADRNRILDPGVMGVKCDDICYTIPYKLLQCKGTVQGLPLVSPVLASLV